MGYLSNDFRNHAVAHLTRGMFGCHDREQFEVWAYSYGPDDGSDYRRDIAQGCDQFVDLAALSASESARRIAADQIDILVDLMGHSGHARVEISALRPAPIQVNFLGFPGTMGAAFMDYFVTDPVATPERLRSSFGEQLVYLPHSYQVNDRQRAAVVDLFSREALGLPRSGFVFCCFNNNYKITPYTFDGWMRILQQAQGSVLLLYAENDWVSTNLKKEAAARGINPERLIFGKPLPLHEYLARYRVADLFLDTLPYNAHTTASDALWAGLPVLTCMGASFAGRVAASLLQAIDLPELITTTPAQYEALAIALPQTRNECSASNKSCNTTGSPHRCLTPPYSPATSKPLTRKWLNAIRRICRQRTFMLHPYKI